MPRSAASGYAIWSRAILDDAFELFVFPAKVARTLESDEPPAPLERKEVTHRVSSVLAVQFRGGHFFYQNLVFKLIESRLQGVAKLRIELVIKYRVATLFLEILAELLLEA